MYFLKKKQKEPWNDMQEHWPRAGTHMVIRALSVSYFCLGFRTLVTCCWFWGSVNKFRVH
jgi:hypothetical protein